MRSTVHAPDGSSYEIYNHNRLLTRYQGAFGVKGGYTVAARASFIAAAERGGHRLLVTLMKTNDGPLSQRESSALLDWGFAATAAGARPVGRLVDPVDVEAARAASRSRPAPRGPDVATSATSPSPSADPLPDWATLGVVAVGLLGVATGGLRFRVLRRRRRRRGRLSLPRL